MRAMYQSLDFFPSVIKRVMSKSLHNLENHDTVMWDFFFFNFYICFTVLRTLYSSSFAMTSTAFVSQKCQMNRQKFFRTLHGRDNKPTVFGHNRVTTPGVN